MKNILKVVFGSMLVGVGISIAVNSNLGLDPLSGVYSVISSVFGYSLSIGTLIVSALMLIFTIAFKRKLIGVGIIVNPVLISLMIAITPNITGVSSLLGRLLVLLLGLTFIGVGTAVYLKGNLGAAPYDATILIAADFSKGSYGRGKVIVDSLFILTTFVYFSRIQIAPLIAVFYVGPVIDYVSSKLSN